MTQLYEQGADRRRIGQYVRNWWCWAMKAWSRWLTPMCAPSPCFHRSDIRKTRYHIRCALIPLSPSCFCSATNPRRRAPPLALWFLCWKLYSAARVGFIKIVYSLHCFKCDTTHLVIAPQLVCCVPPPWCSFKFHIRVVCNNLGRTKVELNKDIIKPPV